MDPLEKAKAEELVAWCQTSHIPEGLLKVMQNLINPHLAKAEALAEEKEQEEAQKKKAAAAAESVGEDVDFDDPVEIELPNEFVHCLPAVTFVRIDVVEVKQDAAVSLGCHERGECAVVDLVGPLAQIVEAGFDGHWHIHGVLQRPNRGCALLDTCEGLARWQEEARESFGSVVETQVFAEPG